MFKSAVERHVKRAVEANVKSENITKDELSAVITDSIYNFVSSRDFIDLVDEGLGKKARRLR